MPVDPDNRQYPGGNHAIAAQKLFKPIWEGVLDLLYPPKCLVCDDMSGKYLCDDCLSEISFIKPPICFRCGAPLDDRQCVECKDADYAFITARSVAVYDGVLKDAIHKLKYSGHEILGPILGSIMVEYLRSIPYHIAKYDCIVPMPIHISRLKQRGFNQAALIANEIGNALGLPVMNGVLVRNRSTHPQVDLPIEDRHSNVLGAFSTLREAGIAGISVILIDDVFTTGSTADAAARALIDGGAREVHVLTMARSL